MRHLENRSLEKCLGSYRFVNLELFHPEQRNFDQNDMRFLNYSRSFFFNIKILRFEIVPFFNLAHAYMAGDLFPSGLKLNGAPLG